jgi:hypothetical protein
MLGRIPDKKGGSFLNNEIDRIIGTDPFSYIFSGNEKGTPYLNKKTGQTGLAKNGQVFLKTRRPYEQADGSKKYGFAGCYDFYDSSTNEIIELKSEWHTELPSEPYKKGYNQVCLYLLALPEVSGAWIIYLPSDLSLLDYNNPETYRAFYISRDEAADYWNNQGEGLITVLDGLAKVGRNPENFYSLIDSLDGCSEEYCCPAADSFRQEVTVNPDWTFTRN